jgi:hypothetical protein
LANIGKYKIENIKLSFVNFSDRSLRTVDEWQFNVCCFVVTGIAARFGRGSASRLWAPPGLVLEIAPSAARKARAGCERSERDHLELARLQDLSWRLPRAQRGKREPVVNAVNEIVYDLRVRFARLLLLTAGLALAVPSCARVKPYERENLSKRSMTADREPGERRFEQHARGSREGADGGTGEAGGGCGCN